MTKPSARIPRIAQLINNVPAEALVMLAEDTQRGEVLDWWAEVLHAAHLLSYPVTPFDPVGTRWWLAAERCVAEGIGGKESSPWARN